MYLIVTQGYHFIDSKNLNQYRQILKTCNLINNQIAAGEFHLIATSA
ncbi:MAG: hypothetical protein ACJAVY_002621 [Marinoscillum sp.]